MLALGLIGLGLASIIVAFVLVWRRWATDRIPPRAVAMFYTGAVIVLIGLQPLRPFRLEYRTHLLPVGDTARAALLVDLRENEWMIGVAKPDSLAGADTAFREEMVERFERYREESPMLRRADAPDFLFVGRRIGGWSRNPKTTALTFLFLGFVFTVAAARYIVRLTPPRHVS